MIVEDDFRKITGHPTLNGTLAVVVGLKNGYFLFYKSPLARNLLLNSFFFFFFFVSELSEV